MRILLDQNTPVGVRGMLSTHDVRTAFQMGWAGLQRRFARRRGTGRLRGAHHLRPEHGVPAEPRRTQYRRRRPFDELLADNTRPATVGRGRMTSIHRPSGGYPTGEGDPPHLPARTLLPTVDRLTPAARASSCCVALGFWRIVSMTFASRSADSRLPIVARPAVSSIPARSARRHTVEKLTPRFRATVLHAASL
jgi:hypothetical protein